MTDPLLAHSTDAGRMYARSIHEEPLVPSITTVIGQQAHTLDGWFGYMAAKAVSEDVDLPQALGNASRMRQVIQRASSAAEVYRDQAAERGDRVHGYCEQVALRALGMDHEVDAYRSELAENGELAFAQQFDAWWDMFKVRPIAPEITVWNHTVGYAGTLDLVAEINGRTCLIDYKTKGTTRDGFVKPLDDKVVMQLVAGMKAEESLLNPDAGEWGAWRHGEQPILMAVAIGETEVRAMRANPEVLPKHWWKFCALKRLWQMNQDVHDAGTALLPLAPPAGP